MGNISRRRVLGCIAVSGIGLGVGTVGVTGGQSNQETNTKQTNARGRDWYNSVLPTTDGGLLLSGAKDTETPGYSDDTNLIETGWAQKLTASGEVAWSKTYPPPPLQDGPTAPDKTNQFYSALRNQEGEYLHLGAHHDGGPYNVRPWLVKTEGNGKIQWTLWDVSAEVASFANDLRDGVVAEDGYLLAGRALGGEIGDERHGDGWAVSLSFDGEVRWNRLYNPENRRHNDWSSDPEHDEFYAITEAHNGNYLLAGEALRTDESASVGWLVEITPDGDTQWQRTYDIGEENLEFADVTRTSDGYLITAATGGVPTPGMRASSSDNQGYIIKVGTDGDVEWRQQIGTVWRAVNTTENGSVVIVGHRDGNAFAGKMSTDGSQLERIVEVRLENSTFFDSASVGEELILVGMASGTSYRSIDGLLVTVGSNNDDGDGPPQNTLTVTKEGVEDGRARFLVASSDGVSPSETGEGVSTGTATLDWLGPARGTDTHYVRGIPETLLVKGKATVRWNGSEIDPDRFGRQQSSVDPDTLSQRLRVESTGTGMGHFAVSTSEGIALTETAEAATDGYSAVDAVGPERGVDEFRFGGEIVRFLSTPHVRVFINDTEVDPNQL